jgi:hypothetical protein
VSYLEEVLNLYYEMFYVLWFTPKDLWNVITIFLGL